MPGLGKHFNEYAAALPAGWYDGIPKAVWAAIAVSKCTSGGDFFNQLNNEVMREWWALYHAKIVPQKPFEKEPPDEL